MNQQHLTEDDLDVLCEALESWEAKGFAGEIMGDLMGALVVDRKNPAQLSEYETLRRKEREKADREKAARKERSVLLRAKLLTIRNDQRVRRVEENVSRVLAVAANQ
jgi:hypothetical protein